MSENGLSYFIRQLISDTGAVVSDVGPVPAAHSVRSMATSVAFMCFVPLSQVLEAATCKTNLVFASYLRDVAHSLGELSFLGPFVAAGQALGLTE